MRISIPYALPALGATYSERSGVINIALEGMLLISAFATTVGTFYTNSPVFGLLCGAVAGLLTGLLHSIITVKFKADQIVSGIAINMFAIGITKFCCQIIFHSSSNSERIVGIEQWDLSATIPFLNYPFLLGTVVLFILANIVLLKTKFGLRLRAVGEHPRAAETLGISVPATRHAGVLISGALAGVGGAWLALDQHSFTDGMSAGRGFIALAAMIVGKWRPFPVAAACICFGISENIGNQLQGGVIPTQFIQMLPYLLTMIVLAGFIGRSTPPAADGIPYEEDQQ